MDNYNALLLDIVENGDYLTNRTGVSTFSVLGRQLRWDLSKGFPAISGKKLAWKAVIGELLWFLSGSSNIAELRRYTGLSDTDFCIWQKNLEQYNARLIANDPERYGGARTPHTLAQPDLGYVYGKAWRSHSSGEDQIKNLIEDIGLVRDNPSHPAARRLIVNAWDPKMHRAKAPEVHCALPPCHYGFQVFVRNGKLSLLWIQRSVDTFLGLPFNIASYAALQHILADICGLEIGELIFQGADVHLYEDHVEQMKELVSREVYDMPTLKMPQFTMQLSDFGTPGITSGRFTASDFTLEGYKCHAAIKANMA